jgi:hypothetical protein
LSGIFLKNPEGLSASADPLRLGGQAAMTESDKNVALLMPVLVISVKTLYEQEAHDELSSIISIFSSLLSRYYKKYASPGMLP